MAYIDEVLAMHCCDARLSLVVDRLFHCGTEDECMLGSYWVIRPSAYFLP